MHGCACRKLIADSIGGDLATLHDTDHTHLTRALGHRHPERDAVRRAEHVFDRLNPNGCAALPAPDREWLNSTDSTSQRSA